MFYLTRQEILQKMGQSDGQLEKLEALNIVIPFTDTNGELIYAESWVEGIKELRSLEDEDLYEYEEYYSAWSTEEARERLMAIIERFDVDLNNPNAVKIWNAYKFFIKEPIRDNLGNRSHDFIETAHSDDQAALHLIRQFSFYDMGREEGFEYDHMDQLTLMLKYEPNEELNKTSLQKRIFSDDDERLEEIESMEDFKTLMRHKPICCLIDQITQ